MAHLLVALLAGAAALLAPLHVASTSMLAGFNETVPLSPRLVCPSQGVAVRPSSALSRGHVTFHPCPVYCAQLTAYAWVQPSFFIATIPGFDIGDCAIQGDTALSLSAMEQVPLQLEQLHPGSPATPKGTLSLLDVFVDAAAGNPASSLASGIKPMAKPISAAAASVMQAVTKGPVVDAVTSELPGKIIEGLFPHLSNNLITGIEEDIAIQVAEGLKKDLPQELSDAVLRTLVPELVDAVVSHVSHTVSDRLATASSARLALSVAERLTARLAPGLGQAVALGVTTVLHESSIRTQAMNVFCSECASEDKHCSYCEWAPQQLKQSYATAGYFAGHYGEHYARYFSAHPGVQIVQQRRSAEVGGRPVYEGHS